MELSIGKLLLLIVIIVLVLGTSKLPKIGEDLGKAVRGFKKAMHEGDSQTPPAQGGDPANKTPPGDTH
jgi:sec-independent protein translocase protein TatA